MKTLKQIFMCAFCLFAFAACKNETKDASTNSQVTEAETTSNKKTGQAFITDDESTPTVLSIAIGSPDHTTLVTAVQAAELEVVDGEPWIGGAKILGSVKAGNGIVHVIDKVLLPPTEE